MYYIRRGGQVKGRIGHPAREEGARCWEKRCDCVLGEVAELGRDGAGLGRMKAGEMTNEDIQMTIRGTS